MSISNAKIAIALMMAFFLVGCEECGGDLADAGLQGKCKSGGMLAEELTPVGVIGGGIDDDKMSIESLLDRRLRIPFELNWDAVDGAESYAVFIGTDAECVNNVYMQDGLTQPYIEIDADIPDGEYYLCVFAYDAEGNEISRITGVRFYIDNTPPPALSQFYWEFSDEVGKVDVVMALPEDVSDFMGLALFRSDADGVMPNCDSVVGDPLFAVADLTSNAIHRYVDTTPEPGRLYHYVACAIDEAGNVGVNELPSVRSTIMTHRIFVTESTYTGDLGGQDGADAICNTSANGSTVASAYEGHSLVSWKAMISTSSNSLVDHVSMRGPVYDASGKHVVARNPEQLFGSKEASLNLNLDQNIKVVSPVLTGIWTGSTRSGRSAQTCLDWTAATGNIYGSTSNATGQQGWVQWLGSESGTNIACSRSRHLYCISQYNVIKLKDFAVANVANQNVMNISLEYAAGHSSGARIELRRAKGSMVAGNCTASSDVVAGEWQIAHEGAKHNVSDSLEPGRHAYRACVYDEYGVMVSSRSAGSLLTDGPEKIREVFVSSRITDGLMGGTTGADASCAQLASRAGVKLPSGLAWRALLGSSNQNASDIANGAQPLLSLRGELVAASQSAIWSPGFAMPMISNEFGEPISSGEVWTGFDATGKKFSNGLGFCDDWNSNAQAGNWGVWGQIGGNTTTWAATDLGGKACSASRRIYCVSTSN